ncbi:MAG: UTP--glucose-1-phosphate uridylyltransferase [Clostridiaceae bacterium]|jgi:UTP--glucose-1-phosphate uridylyltransferase|nr:UTP--glucose-1-phosphate uridylyltransferase [Clostridiaceae bacterium]
MITKAFIPCAGFGTRFLPATKAVPKEMLPIVDTPALQYIVSEAVESGIKEILILISPGKKAIVEHFARSGELEALLIKTGKRDVAEKLKAITAQAEIRYAVQDEMKGTGSAVAYAKSWAGGQPFAVLFGDDVIVNDGGAPVTAQLMEAYEKTFRSVIGVQEMPEEIARRCGVMIPGKSKGKYHEVRDIMEKPGAGIPLPSKLTSLGRFVLSPDIFDFIDRTPSSKNGEIYLTDALALQAKHSGVFAYEFEGKRYDIGNKLGYIIANIEFGLKNPETAEGLKAYLKEWNKL